METNKKLEVFESFAKGSAKKDDTGNKCVIYTRVSTKDQADNNMSLTTQKKLCEQFCVKHNYEIIGYFGGTYESAKNDERKEFNNMLAFIKRSKEKISQIIVYSIDRFSRSGANAIYIKEQLKKQGVTIQSVSQPTDTSTSSGRLQQNIHFIFSDFDNELRRDKCVTGMREALMRGEWCQRAPMGYDHIKQNGKKMIVVNALGKKLKNVFIWKAKEGISHEEIKIRLEKQGVDIASQRVSDIIKNPFYCGLISHNLLEGKIVEGNHEKLVSRELFLQANEVKQGNTGGYKISIPNDEIPLKHFLKCDQCGCYMRGYKAYKNQKYYYKCGTRGCNNNKRADELHMQFQKILEQYSVTVNDSMHGIIKKYMEHTYLQLHQETDNEREIVEQQVKDINRKIERLEERFIAEDIRKEMFEKYHAQYIAERKEIELKIKNLPLKTSNLEKCVEKAILLSGKLNTVWSLADYSQKQKLQNLIFPEGMTYHKKNDLCRTQRVNTVFAAIADLSSASRGIKKEKCEDISHFSGWVGAHGFEPRTLCL